MISGLLLVLGLVLVAALALVIGRVVRDSAAGLHDSAQHPYNVPGAPIDGEPIVQPRFDQHHPHGARGVRAVCGAD